MQAVIFDLDGVITDTSDLHYSAWKRLADEEGIAFDRHANERLRGVSRRDSLLLLLGERTASDTQMQEMMERKNRYYVESLASITPTNLLPGALDLLNDLRKAGIRIALGSASHNAPTVIEHLGIRHLFDAIADGSHAARSKPAPDVFLAAAEMLGVAPAFCVVVEDAEAGVEAALAAGMWAIGIGPDARVGAAHLVLPNLAGVTAATLQAGIAAAAWEIIENGWNRAEIGHRETILTIGNGNFCVRGALEERIAGDNPACFVHRIWDDMPVTYTELANIPRWYGVEVWVNGVEFGIERGKVVSQRRVLDLRTGVLTRIVQWRPDAGEAAPLVELHFERWCSMAQASLAAVRLRVTLLEGDVADVRIRSGFDHHVENTALLHWHTRAQGQSDNAAFLHVQTRATQIDLVLAAEMTSWSEAPVQKAHSDSAGQPAMERRASLATGHCLEVEKYVHIVSSLDDDNPEAAAQQLAQQARQQGFNALRAQSDAVWKQVWHDADVCIEGDNEAQVAQRFNTFQLVIAAPAFTQRASIGAKSLSGFGYRHHVFWDTEIFILPLFTYTLPHLARNMLFYRYHNLPGARKKALDNGHLGAQFPWESAGDGTEVTPVWVPHFADPTQLIRIWTGDIEIHITADIAYACMQYWHVTGDDAWMRDFGAEIILDGAKFWASAAQLEADGKRHFRNVIGPDEYHDRIDNNAYTNHFARWHIETALALREWLQKHAPDKAAALQEKLEIDDELLAFWREVETTIHTGVVTESGVIEQFAGYFDLEEPDFAFLRDPNRKESMQAHLGIEGCTETQNIKQPDVLMLQYLLPERFTPEQIAANYAYYDPRTDHELGSSLGPSISAIMACRAGHPEQAYAHYMRAARADLQDVRHNANDGIHAASAGGMWQAAVLGFGGLQVTPDGWEVHPALPGHWTRLSFTVRIKGESHLVTIDQEGVVQTERKTNTS
jgi:kojibiose phosphorylase